MLIYQVRVRTDRCERRGGGASGYPLGAATDPRRPAQCAYHARGGARGGDVDMCAGKVGGAGVGQRDGRGLDWVSGCYAFY